MSKYEDKANTLFKEGYNCAQAVVSAFSDELEIDKETVLRLTSSFGGGMGRLREVCGAVSGMFMVAGLLNGYIDPKIIRLRQNTIKGYKNWPNILKKSTVRLYAENCLD